MKRNVVVYDFNGHGYYITISSCNKCNCNKDNSVYENVCKQNNLIWYNRNYTYRFGSCIGQEVCCKYCNKIIGVALNDPIIGITRNGLGEEC